MTTKEHRDQILDRGRIPQAMTIAEAAKALMIIRDELYANQFKATPLQAMQLQDIAWMLSSPAARAQWVNNTNTEINAMASAFGRKGGQAKSERKTAAVRENGKKGGRPKKEK